MSADTYSHVKAADRGEAEERREAFRLQAEAQAGQPPSRTAEMGFRYFQISPADLKA